MHAGGVLSQTDSQGTTDWLLADALGSVRGIADGSGALSGSAEYEAFGTPRAQAGTSSIFGFTGEQTDASTGNLYLRARYHAPSTGRFLSADTIQPNAAGTQGYNRYSYVANNPATWVDPSGHEAATISQLGNSAINNLLNVITLRLSAAIGSAETVAPQANANGVRLGAIAAAEAVVLRIAIAPLLTSLIAAIQSLMVLFVVPLVGMVAGLIVFIVATLIAATLLYILGLMFVLIDPWNFFPDILAPSDLAPALVNEDIGTLVTTYPVEPDWRSCFNGIVEEVTEEFLWAVAFGGGFNLGDLLFAAGYGCMTGGGGGGPPSEIVKRIQKAGLPTSGEFFYLLPKRWKEQRLPRTGNGFRDDFGNVWQKGPYHGQDQAFSFEWDVQLSSKGRRFFRDQYGVDVNRVNVSPDGRVRELASQRR